MKERRIALFEMFLHSLLHTLSAVQVIFHPLTHARIDSWARILPNSCKHTNKDSYIQSTVNTLTTHGAERALQPRNQWRDPPNVSKLIHELMQILVAEKNNLPHTNAAHIHASNSEQQLKNWRMYCTLAHFRVENQIRIVPISSSYSLLFFFSAAINVAAI